MVIEKETDTAPGGFCFLQDTSSLQVALQEHKPGRYGNETALAAGKKYVLKESKKGGTVAVESWHHCALVTTLE